MTKTFKCIIFFILFSAFVAVDLQAEPLASIANKKSENLLPKRIIAGFLDIRTPGSATRVNMQLAKADGYNVMIIAFGEVYGTNIGFYTSDSASDISAQTTVDKIRNAKAAGMKVLLALGGAPNTFHPGIKPGDPDPRRLGKDMSKSQIGVLATNIVDFLKSNNIDGITFSLKKFISPDFLDILSMQIKKIDPYIVIAAEPEVDDYNLVTSGSSNDYDQVIHDGYIDYLFIQEYNTFPEYDPAFISKSYLKIIKNSKIPLKTKVLIEEPTNAVSGATNTIYHPEANATKSLTTKEAVNLMLPQLEKLKFKPRFAGVAGWSLNTDYAADLYGDSLHNPGSFAKGLSHCIYKNICASVTNKIDGPMVAGFLTLWAKNSSYNISGQQINTSPVNIKMPKDQEYCDENPSMCKYDVIIAAYLSYNSNEGFQLTFNEENGSSKKIYTPKQLQIFVNYMKSKGKHVLISVGGKFSHIDWQTINFEKLIEIVQEYGFSGINFNLTDSDIPKGKRDIEGAARKIDNLMKKIKQDDSDFWLTFSPNWHYIVAPLAKNNKDNVHASYSYLDLLEAVGIDNINYIWLNTFSEKPADGISSFDKDSNGQYLKISPADGYAKFLASLAWTLTTKEGSNINRPKYKLDKPFVIPASKLVFVIPATEGAARSGMIYVLSKQDMNDIIDLMKENKASFAGFAVWSIDFDATNIKQGDLSDKYSHRPWSTTDAISNITLPPVVLQISSQLGSEKKKIEAKSKDHIIDTGIINYPDQIGFYDDKTIVSYQGKKYRCISNLELRFCNDNAYIPNGLYGYLAWNIVDDSNHLGEKHLPKAIVKGEVLRYPNSIGNYQSGQVVIVGDRKYECQLNKQVLCNSISYTPMGSKGYSAWTDVTNDIVYLDENKQTKPAGANYIYPNSIESYSGGTIVALGQELYRCKVGPESSLCSMEAYDPAGKYGSDAWTKVDR